jgi:hypothetical protein
MAITQQCQLNSGGWYFVVGNMVGGLALVTLLRLLQQPYKVIEARDDDDGQPSDGHRG